MRVIRPHVTSEGTVDYYECSACGWAYPFPRFAKESEKDLPNAQMAEQAFAEHRCEEFPQRAKT